MRGQLHLSRSTGWALPVLGLLVTLASCSHDSSTGPQAPPTTARLDLVGGDQQTGTVGEELAEPITVIARDASGRPVAGQLVNFRVTRGNGSVYGGTALTDANGHASERWQLGTSAADSQAVEARATTADGQKQLFATFHATARPASAKEVVALFAVPERSTVGDGLADSLRVRVIDRYGNPVPNTEVHWATGAGQGTLSAGLDTTDKLGESAVDWTLGTSAGADTARASIAASATAAVFATTAQPASASLLTAVAGDNQRGPVGQVLHDSLVVVVRDRFGNGVPGLTVMWDATDGGGAVTPETATTRADGTARALWTLGTSVGANSVGVTVAGLATIAFEAQAIAGPPARIVPSGQQVGALGAPLPSTLSASVEDQFGNAVPNIEVDWVVLAGGGAIEPASSRTDSTGTATARWVLGTRLDTVHRASVTARGTSVSAFYTAIPALPADAVLSKVSGDAQSDTVARVLDDSLVSELRLSDGRPVVGASVTWATEPGAGSVSPTSAATNEEGRASAAWRLDTIVGIVGASATLSSGQSVKFTAQATAAAPARLAAFAGDGQFGRPGGTLPDSLAVRITDRYGNAVVGVTLNWEAGSGGTIAPATAASDAYGVARASWTLGALVGPQAATARTAAGLSVTFGATASAGVNAVTMGSWHTCALLDSGSVECWGSNYFGESGNGSADTLLHARPTRAASNYSFATLGAGGGSVCGVAAGGAGFCWGLNDRGQVAPGAPTTPCAGSASSCVTAPASIPNLVFATIVAGRTHTCGLTTSGDAYCWGDNRYGELGDGGTTSSGIPVPVAGGHTFATISVGENLTCALGTDAVGYCWGSGSYGGLGVGVVPDLCYDQFGRNGAPCAKLPTPLAGGMTYASVDASGFAGGCAVTKSGDAYCWGDNEFGAVGDGTVTSRPSPVRVVGASAFTSISAGWTHSCGVVAGGSIYCWGSNRYGELAADTSTVYTSFTARLVVGGPNWATVTAKNDATCAVSIEGHLYCWGNNFYGRLGDGTTSHRDVPTLVF